MKRREFLTWLYRTVWAIWGLIGLWGLRRFPSPKEKGLGDVGDLSGLSPGESRLVHLGTRPVLLIRPDRERIVALSALCTHLRCGLPWNPETRGLPWMAPEADML